MYRVYHGLADSWNAPTMRDALKIVEVAMASGLHNLLIARADAVVTGRTDYADKRDDGRVGTNVMEVAIMPSPPWRAAAAGGA